MSTVAAERPAATAAGVDARPSLGRLTLVELRKTADTRAGFWLLLATVGLTVAVGVLVAIFGDEPDRTLRNLMEATIQVPTVLVPVVGILLVTSEWSQRTAQVTFTLVPQRERVLLAKVLAGILLALAALVTALAVAAVCAAVAGSGVDDQSGFSLAILGQQALYLVTAMLMGIGFGAAILASAPAIVLFFALPLAWAAIGSIPALEGAARWLDTTRALDPMYQDLMTGTEWARAGTSLALWMLLPLAIGTWRLLRSEVR